MGLNVNGIVSKVESKAEDLAIAYGIIADPIANGRGLTGAVPFMIDRLQNWKIPDINQLLAYLEDPALPYNKNLMYALYAYLGNIGLDILGQARLANAAKNVAVGLVKGTALATILWLPAVNPKGAHSPNDYSGKSNHNSGAYAPSNYKNGVLG